MESPCGIHIGNVPCVEVVIDGVNNNIIYTTEHSIMVMELQYDIILKEHTLL